MKEKKRHYCYQTAKLLLDEFKQELMIGMCNAEIQVMQIKTKKFFTIKIAKSEIWSLIYFRENHSFFFGTGMGEIVEWKEGKLIKNVKIGKDRISEMIMYQGRLVVVSFDGCLRILDPLTLNVLFEKKMAGYLKFTWILNVKNQYFVTCGVNGSCFHVWYLNPMKLFQVLKRKRDLNIFFNFE
jgi:hypothetical protein